MHNTCHIDARDAETMRAIARKDGRQCCHGRHSRRERDEAIRKRDGPDLYDGQDGRNVQIGVFPACHVPHGWFVKSRRSGMANDAIHALDGVVKIVFDVPRKDAAQQRGGVEVGEMGWAMDEKDVKQGDGAKKRRHAKLFLEANVKHPMHDDAAIMFTPFVFFKVFAPAANSPVDVVHGGNGVYGTHDDGRFDEEILGFRIEWQRNPTAWRTSFNFWFFEQTCSNARNAVFLIHGVSI